MDLTTAARVGQLIAPGAALQPDDESLYNRLIQTVSEAARRFLDREVLTGTKTEYFDVSAWQQVFQLKAYPVTSVTSVKFDTDQEFGSDTTLDTDEYWSPVLEPQGLLTLKSPPLALGRAPKSLKVVYVGGMAADVEAFVTAYPDIAGAIDQQCAYLYHRRNQQGVASVSSEFGTFVAPVPALTEWVPYVRSVLNRHRRIVIAA